MGHPLLKSAKWICCAFRTRGIHIPSRTAPIVRFENAAIYKFGSATDSDAVLRDVSWEINRGEAWAVISISNSTRGELFQALLGRRRIHQIPNSGIFPSWTPEQSSARDAILHVAFSSKANVAAGGEFVDYTARYGAMRDQDGQTLRENLVESLSQDPPPRPRTEFDIPGTAEVQLLASVGEIKRKASKIDVLADRLRLVPQLDIPMIALSNGQRRRARILRQLIKEPLVLLLEEPFAGLDVVQRPLLSTLLHSLNANEDPFVLIELRPQDPVPQWITHIAIVDGPSVVTIPSAEYSAEDHAIITPSQPSNPNLSMKNTAPILARLVNVRVAYGEREVLKEVNWTIRKGDRWWLRGPNGSGKTTLLSLLSGEHPQSYTQRHFELFGKPRQQVPTVSIQRQIASSTPEIFAAFPRRSGPGAMTAADAIGTGFEGTYAYRHLTEGQRLKRDSLIRKLGPGDTEADRLAWGKQLFATLPPAEQALVMLMRVLVSDASILILDEVFAGMDDSMINRAREYLQKEVATEKAIIFVTHWEHEVPWSNSQMFLIEDGIGKVMIK